MHTINPDDQLEYDFIAQSYYAGGEIKVDRYCNGFTAINTGDTLVFVCGIPLLPYPPGHPELSGAAVAIPGNKGEYFRGRIWIVFADAPAVVPSVLIIQKFYK
jgi:hypothetical protein